MMKPEANYKTFEELEEYARQRAKISAGRRGHQEFMYWVNIMAWAQGCVRIGRTIEMEWNFYVDAPADIHSILAVRIACYAKLVHLRKMRINRGESLPRLTLDWLREEAERL